MRNRLVGTLGPDVEAKQERSGLGSGREVAHQLYNEFGEGKLDSVNFQGVPTDEAQHACYRLWWLDATRAAQKYTHAKGHDADAQNEYGELDLRKREFLLFLPDVDDRRDNTGQQAHQACVLCYRVRRR